MTAMQIFDTFLAIHQPDEQERKIIYDFILSVITKINPMDLTDWQKLRKAFYGLKKIKFPDNVKKILIHLVIETTKNRMLR